MRIFLKLKVWSAIQDVLKNIKKIYREKSAKAARQSRLEGDEALKLGDVKKAVMLYSQSVIRAPSQGIQVVTCTCNFLSCKRVNVFLF